MSSRNAVIEVQIVVSEGEQCNCGHRALYKYLHIRGLNFYNVFHKERNTGDMHKPLKAESSQVEENTGSEGFMEPA